MNVNMESVKKIKHKVYFNDIFENYKINKEETHFVPIFYTVFLG